MQEDDYLGCLRDSGFSGIHAHVNPAYRFISRNARAACGKYGVKSISLRAVRIT